jgi:DNA-directed RNA polymerase subunit RPC12/RpoP
MKQEFCENCGGKIIYKVEEDEKYITETNKCSECGATIEIIKVKRRAICNSGKDLF